MRIDDADAVARQEPQFSIRGFGDLRAVAARLCTCPDSVGTVKNRDLDRALRISDPRVQLGPGNAQQAAAHVQPERMVVVFHRPVNGVAGQAVLAGKRCDTAVFQPAQPALGCSPERTVPIKLKAVDAALTQAIGAPVRMRGSGRP
jgi:hypothetical protein